MASLITTILPWRIALRLRPAGTCAQGIDVMLRVSPHVRSQTPETSGCKTDDLPRD